MKTGILVVSVGTSQIEAIESTSVRLVQKMKSRFHEIKCYLGFSNQRILDKMKSIKPDTFYSVEEALEQMLIDGVEEAVVMPTYLLNGMENDGMLATVEKYRARFKNIRIGKPLLNSKEDYTKVLAAVLSEAALAEDEALVLVGHGSQLSNNVYQNLEYTAYVQGLRNVFVGTIDGGKSQTMALRKLQAAGFKRVRLMPLLFVAAHHAKKDIAGEHDSWKCALCDAGFLVSTDLKGLGEQDAILDIFMEHLLEAMER